MKRLGQGYNSIAQPEKCEVLSSMLVSRKEKNSEEAQFCTQVSHGYKENNKQEGFTNFSTLAEFF